MTTAPSLALDRGVPLTARWLGWAGLFPFVALAAATSLAPTMAVTAAALLADYAFGILCFLLGIWWGIGVMRADPAPLLWSNALYIVLFFARAMLHGAAFMVIAAVLFIVLLVLEHRLPVFRRQPAYYAALRSRLSLVAAAALLVGAWQHS